MEQIFHFVANLIAFKMNTNLTSDYTSILFLGMKIPLSSFFLTQSVYCAYPLFYVFLSLHRLEMKVNRINTFEIATHLCPLKCIKHRSNLFSRYTIAINRCLTSWLGNGENNVWLSFTLCSTVRYSYHLVFKAHGH